MMQEAPPRGEGHVAQEPAAIRVGLLWFQPRKVVVASFLNHLIRLCNADAVTPASDGGLDRRGYLYDLASDGSAPHGAAICNLQVRVFSIRQGASEVLLRLSSQTG